MHTRAGTNQSLIEANNSHSLQMTNAFADRTRERPDLSLLKDQAALLGGDPLTGIREEISSGCTREASKIVEVSSLITELLFSINQMK